jgi:hypothetical protein
LVVLKAIGVARSRATRPSERGEWRGGDKEVGGRKKLIENERSKGFREKEGGERLHLTMSEGLS